VVPEGIVYLRTDITGKIVPYGGQAMSDARYLARQAEHAPATPAATLAWSYDANGNIRSLAESYAWLTGDGSVHSTGSATYWYRYDGMNRVVTDRGQLVGGAIVRGTTGVDIAYDALGRRTTVQGAKALIGTLEVYVPGGNGGGGGTTPPMPDDGSDPGDGGHYEQWQVNYNGESRESYAYDTAGNLAAVTVLATGYYDNGHGAVESTGVFSRAMGGARTATTCWGGRRASWTRWRAAAWSTTMSRPMTPRAG
jgi:hypothetical protein